MKAAPTALAGFKTLFPPLPMVPKPVECRVKTFDENAPLYTIVLNGDPVPWARPRAQIIKKFNRPPYIHFFSDKDVERYRRSISKAALAEVKNARPIEDQPVGIRVRVFLLPPQSWSKKQQARALRDEILPMTRPDADNYLKLILDALNGIVFKDDGQVTDIQVSKRYAERAGIEVEIFV